MKITEIRIDELKPTGSYLNSRMGVTISISEDTEIEKAFALGKQIIDETHKKNFPTLYNKEGQPLFGNYAGEDVPEVQQTGKKEKLTGFAHWENEINNCTTIEKPDGIEGLRMIADSNPKLKEVFNNKLNQLKNEQGN